MTTDEEITIEEKFWQAHFVVCQNAPAKEDGRKIMLEAAVMMATKLIAEARASGFREGQRSKTAYKLGKQDGKEG